MTAMIKMLTLMFWLLAAIVWWEGYQVFFLEWIPKVALILLAVHLVEVVVFWVLWRAKSRFPVLDAAMILVFGVFHLLKFTRKEKRVASF